MKWLFILMSLLMSSVLAQGALVGEWEGQIGPGSLNLGVVVHFTAAGDTLEGSIDIPAQGAAGRARAVSVRSAAAAATGAAPRRRR